MTQFNPPAINPAVTSGSDLANYLEGVRDASYSTHKGTSRPSYACDGLLWMKDVSSTAWEIYAISGPKDVLLGTINPASGTYSASNVAGVYLKTEVDTLIAALNSNLSSLSTTVAGKADTATVAAATTPPGSMVFYGGRRAPSGYLKCNGASYTAASQPALFAALVFYSNATITIGADATVAWANHGLGVNDPVKFTTTGALPAGLVVGTTYYVAAAGLATNSFRISATPGGATITTSGTQSGIQKAISAPWGCTNDLVSFNVPEMRGEFPRGHTDGRAGVDDARVFASAQADELRSHVHGSTRVQAGTGIQPASGAGWGVVIGATDAAGGVETRPRNVAANWIIKT